jgi:adenylyltransferase/sulfurtransferase
MKEVSVQELKKMMDENQEFQLIDVREEYEFDAANLSGELIPLATIIDNKGKVRTDIPVIIHCKAGGRSAVAVNALESQFGFTNLHNLKGGILAYAAEIDSSLSPI